MVEKLDILAFGAHPDDVEIGAAGILTKHAKNGYTVGICDLTYAELSSNGNPKRRQEEAFEASNAMGIHVRLNLGYPDRGLYLRKEFIDGVVNVIRRYQPKIVLAPYWEDRHPDHVACQKIVEEAIFSAGIQKYDTGESFTKHKVSAFYHYFINDEVTPTVMVDISEHYHEKRMALESYSSQFMTVINEEMVQTPLNDGYLEMVESRDRLLGHKIGSKYAEGLVSKRPVLQSFIVPGEGE